MCQFTSPVRPKCSDAHKATDQTDRRKHKTFSFTNPILTDENNTIVAGHDRRSAAQLLGIDRVPTIRLEKLSEDQIRAYILSDNKLAERAGWDESILAIELQHLMTVDLGFDVTITGFEVPEIDLILQPNRPEAE